MGFQMETLSVLRLVYWCRGIMSLATALSPVTVKGPTCPGSTQGQELGQRQPKHK